MHLLFLRFTSQPPHSRPMKKLQAVFSQIALSSLAAAGLAMFATPAQAGSFSSCVGSGYDISDNVTGTSNCAISDDFSQDFQNGSSDISEYTVNEAGFFGSSDWQFSGKLGVGGFAGSGEGQSGTWDISDVIQDSWDDVMLVFKSGNKTQLVGYQVEDGVTSGSWQSVYEKSVGAFNFNGKNTKDVSHISVYYNVIDTPEVSSVRRVPEPMALSSLALVSAAAVIRRRKKQAELS